MTDDRAERLAVARAMLAETDASRRRGVAAPISFGRLMRYATDPAAEDSVLAGALESDPQVASTFAQLVRRIARYHAPEAAAAAGVDALDRRHGEGWTLSLRPTRSGTQTWVIIMLEYPDSAPEVLFAGDQRRPLPQFDGDRVQFRIGAQTPLAMALRDPATPLYLI